MILRTIVIAAGLLTAVPGHAQHAAGHHGTGPNGGRIEEGSGYHLELVAKDRRLDMYLTDEAQTAIPAAGYKATAILVVGGKPARIVLEPGEGNRLSGSADGPVAADAKGAVRLTRPDGKTASISFH